ncbi:hypothetical protein [Marinibacterium profundimaris]|uniref:hypothetical protein n=1 Tax=Marinibacterium profundimaris TaxID=1679460 RepID=UPI000B523A91|nr:hypothetical protein [Marinibacterium profundimaris]
MADDAQAIWKKPVILGGAVTVLLLMTGTGLGRSLIAGIAAVGIGHLIFSRVGGRKTAQESGAGTVQATAAAPHSAAPQAEPAPAPSSEPAPVAPAAPVADTAPAEVPKAGTPEGAMLVKPSTPLPGEAELAARKGTWKYTPGGA